MPGCFILYCLEFIFSTMRNTSIYSTTAPAVATHRSTELRFKPISQGSIPVIQRFVANSGSRANDFTVGGILMWAEYFHYEYCVVCDTLFIKGLSEIDSRSAAFSLPIGRMSMADSIGRIIDYCKKEGLVARLSAVPEDRIAELEGIVDGNMVLLDDWSDYIYEAAALASLSGKKLSKKRNHVNRFITDNPDYRVEWLSDRNIGEARDAYVRWIGQNDGAPDGGDSALEESTQTLRVMDNLRLFPFEGMILRGRGGNVVAFTLGEVIGDTLFTHIEKMDHDVAGAGEAVNKFFAEMMTQRHPAIRYINREEDAGDAGLRQAKLSYHPAVVLKKYDVVLHSSGCGGMATS